MKKVYIITAFLFPLALVFGQKAYTLDEALSIALQQSYAIKSAEYNLLSSRKSLESARLSYMTSVNLEMDLPNYSRTLSNQFNTSTGSQEFYQTENTIEEGRLYIDQPLVFSNGKVSIVGRLFGRDQLSPSGSTNRDYYSNLSIRLQQPLFTFNNQKASLEKAEINLEKAQRNYNRAKQDIVYNVTASFYDLYQAKKSLEIAKEKVDQIKVSYETAQNKFKAGLIAEVEALQLELDLASGENELLNARRRFEESKNNFKLQIGIDLNDSIDVAAQLEYRPVSVEVEKAVELALKNRYEIKNAESDIRVSQLGLDEIDSKGNVRVDLSANYGINKNDGRFKDIFHSFAEDRSVTMTLSVPVWDWGSNRRAVESSRANLDLLMLTKQNQQDLIINEIKQVVSKLQAARARVEVLAKTVELAEKSYNISLARFKSGTITSFDLSQMQIRLTDARTNSLNALIDYKLAVADLNRKTLFDFDKETPLN
jgi:outer membrane protein TolC